MLRIPRLVVIVIDSSSWEDSVQDAPDLSSSTYRYRMHRPDRMIKPPLDQRTVPDRLIFRGLGGYPPSVYSRFRLPIFKEVRYRGAYDLVFHYCRSENLAQSSTHHGTDSFKRVRPSILLFHHSGSPAGLVRWLHWGEDGVPICPSGGQGQEGRSVL